MVHSRPTINSATTLSTIGKTCTIDLQGYQWRTAPSHRLTMAIKPSLSASQSLHSTTLPTSQIALPKIQYHLLLPILQPHCYPSPSQPYPNINTRQPKWLQSRLSLLQHLLPSLRDRACHLTTKLEEALLPLGPIGLGLSPSASSSPPRTMSSGAPKRRRR